MRVLITGATGFLGYHLCRKLLSLGHETSAFHRAQSRTEEIAALGVRLVRGDFDDSRGLRHAVAGQDLVIHAAANIRSWAPDPALQNHANAENSGKLAEACRAEGVGRLIHVSSVSAIGIPVKPDPPADETFKFNLSGRRFNYHISKKKAEEAVLREVDQGLNALIVNPGSLFGPFGQRYRGSEILLKATRGRIVPCFSGGRCIVHVEDAVTGILSAARLGARGTRYILGGDNVSFRQIALFTAKLTEAHPTLVPVPSSLTRILMNTGESMAPGSMMHRLNAAFTDGLFQYYSSRRATTDLGYSYRGLPEIAQECIAFTRAGTKPIEMVGAA